MPAQHDCERRFAAHCRSARLVRPPSRRHLDIARLSPEGLQDLAELALPTGWHFGFKHPASWSTPAPVVLVRGIRESARTNNMMVGVKLIAILIFVFAPSASSIPATTIPSCQRFSGILTRLHHLLHLHRLRLGLDRGRRMQEPAADLPIGSSQLVVCTVLYVAVAVCLTAWCPGIHGGRRPPWSTPSETLAEPAATRSWIRLVVLFGA